MEGDLKVQIGVGIDEALSWLDGKVLSESLLVPSEVSFHVTKVAHLESLGQSAVFDNAAESDLLIHDFELNTVSCA
jgi:hypothetical protein